MVLRDITKEKSLEQERDEFISVASHELRTPIAIAEGSLSNVIALKQQRVDPAIVDQSLKAAHDQVLLLAKMTNDLATLSRAERGADIEVEPIDVRALFAKLHTDYEPQAKAKGLTFLTRVNDPIEPLLSGKIYLLEILQNLITNALKYTKQGSVMVTASMDVRGVATFSVEDTGIGISRTDQRHLFTKFWRSEDYRTRESSGTGLGLYIVKRLAEQLGGRVDAESQLDHGTTFVVTIPPFTKTTAPDAPQSDAISAQ
jgi:signal transduction histidine kinase